MEKANQLRVSVVSGKDLVKAKADAYVVVSLLDEAGKAVGKPRTTKVVKKSANPHWEESISFDVAANAFAGIQLSVWHKQLLLPDKFMGQVTIKFNKEVLASTSLIDDSFPLSARPNKKDSVKGALQLKIQYGEVKEGTSSNNNNAVIDDKDKPKHDNLKVSSRWGDQDPNLHKSAFVVVTDDNPKSPRDDDSISEEEPEELPESEFAPFETYLGAVDALEANKIASAAETSNDAEDEEPVEETKPAGPAEPLNKEAVDKLLARAEPIKSEEGDEKNFAVRETSLKAPKTGERINQPFPPPAEERPEEIIDIDAAKKLAKTEAGELKVLRQTPLGNLTHAVTTMSITFNQPMVAVTGLEELKQVDIVQITPRPPGRFVWKGTDTVQFEAEGRFPFSTNYKVKVPKGTKSQLDGVLANDFEFEFTTNTPVIVSVHYLSNFSKRIWSSGKSSYPTKLDCLEPTIAVCFDQKINAKDVFALLKVSSDAHPKLLNIEDTIARMEEYGIDTNEINRNTYFGFEFKKPLKPNTGYNVTIGPNVPSAEGPLTTSRTEFNFETYPKFGVIQPFHPTFHPRATWRVYFTNPIDARSFNEKLVTITPPLKNATFKLDNDPSNGHTVIMPGGTFGLSLNLTSVIIENDSKPNTDYKITFGRELIDVYGQKLTENDTYRLSVGPGYDSLTGPSNMTVLDPATHPTYTPIVVGYHELKVKVYQVNPTQYFQVADCFSNRSSNKTRLSSFGKVVYDHVIQTDVEPCTPKQILIDLQSYLQFPKENLGQLVVKVEPTEAAWRVFHKNHYDNYKDYHVKLFSWVQSTRMCVDTIYSKHNTDLLVWASHLASGKPAIGANISAPNGRSGKVNNDGIILFEKFGSATSGVVMCKLENDVAFTPISYSGTIFDTFNWFVFDDRKLYRPKEEVFIKGFARKVTRDAEMRVVPKFASGEFTYSFRDPRGAELAKGTLKFNEFGAFDLKLTLPDNMNLGEATIYFYGPTNHSHQIKVEEFRRPEYEVSSSYYPITNHVATKAGGCAIAKAKAVYFSGGGLSDATVAWSLQDSDAFYSPPGWSKFSFGQVRPWWLNAPTFTPYTYDGIISQFFRVQHIRPSYNRGRRDKRPIRRKIYDSDDDIILSPSLGIADPLTIEADLHPRHLSAKTDGNGEHEVKVCYAGNITAPKTLKAIASITDLNYQTRETATSFLLHPSSRYIGVNMKRSYGKPKDLFPMEIIVTDIDGKAVEGTNFWIKQTCSWVADEKDQKGLTKEVNKTETKLIKLVSKATPVVYEYYPVRGGKYEFEFITVDDKKLKNETKITFTVSGGKAAMAPKIAKVAQEVVTIIPDKQAYSPFDGETEGELLVQTPFKPAEGLLSILCEGIVHTQRFTVTDDSILLKFPVKEIWQPNAQLQVDLMGSQPRALLSGALDLTSPPRPAFAKGLANISIRNKSDVLHVEAKSGKSSYKPGAQATVDVVVKDASDKPVAKSEVCVVVVDESVLALTGYSIDDPLSYFYKHRPEGVGFTYLRSAVLLVSVEDLAKMKENAPVAVKEEPEEEKQEESKMKRKSRAAPMKMMKKESSSSKDRKKSAAPMEESEEEMCKESDDMDVSGAAQEDDSSITVRSNFTAIANFSPSCVTDKDGKISVSFQLPDSLTRYRIWAVAATERQFGIGESTVVAQLPFMVRPSFPRFLNFGDKAECSVVLQNQTDSDLNIRVAARCTNAKFGANFGGGYTLTIPALRRAAVFIPVETKFAGTARFQIVASSDDFSDAAEISLPVWTPATSEAFATYGDISDKTVVFQPVKAPAGVYKEFGGFEVSTSSTILQSLTDAVLYLYKYEFDCSEQLASRILGIVSLKDVLQAFNVPEMPSTLAILLKLKAELQDLNKRQENTDFKSYCKGGFYFWTRPTYHYRVPDAFLSVHVTNCLAKSIEKGVTVDKELLGRAHQFLKTLDQFLSIYYWYLGTYSRRSLLAYSYYVRHKLGEDVVQIAKQCYEQAGNEGVTMEALGWLMMAMSTDHSNEVRAVIQKILVYLKNRSNETAETANFITKFSDQEGKYVMLHSDRRTDGILLEAFLTVDKENSIIPKLAKGLLAHRKAGRWNNTQENCFILIALDLYFAVYEKDEPDFNTQVWLGEIFAGEQVYKGRSTDTNIINVPMKLLCELGETDLILTKQGPGRLYYRLGLNYAPEDLRLKAACYGFKLSRTYEGVDSASHVTKDEKGNWHFKLGKKIRVIITMTTTSRRYHVALVDKLPAGLEIVNSSLKGTETGETQQAVIDRGGNYNPFTTRVYHEYQWYEHQNLRDERAEAFKSLLWEGHYVYRYLCRATCEGVFVVPPAKAEEMYSPEIFGRTGTDIAYIEK